MNTRTHLTWIDDIYFVEATKFVTDSYYNALIKAQSQLEMLDIDPVQDIFEKTLVGPNFHRSQYRTQTILNSATTHFHRMILAHCEGWSMLEEENLIYNKSRTAYATVRAKPSSLNNPAKRDLYRRFHDYSLSNEDATYYIVYLLDNNTSYNRVWNYSGGNNDRIKEISGDLFYHLVTNEPNALRQLSLKLPEVLNIVAPVSYDVFLSYSRNDTEFMQEIRRILERANLKVWVDIDNLVPGTDEWERRIVEAIKETKCCLTLLSPDAERSPWVNREIAMAEIQGKRIFPILIKGNESTAIPLRLIRNQWIDYRNHDAENIRRLVDTIQQHILTFKGR